MELLRENALTHLVEIKKLYKSNDFEGFKKYVKDKQLVTAAVYNILNIQTFRDHVFEICKFIRNTRFKVSIPYPT